MAMLPTASSAHKARGKVAIEYSAQPDSTSKNRSAAKPVSTLRRQALPRCWLVEGDGAKISDMKRRTLSQRAVHRHHFLCRLPVPARCDHLRGVAVLPFPAEPAHGPGTAGRPWHRSDLRDGAALVGEGWAGHCPAYPTHRPV